MSSPTDSSADSAPPNGAEAPSSQPEGPARAQPDTWDVFIAYARADQPAAELLYDTLTPRLKVFLDVRVLQPGTDWDLLIPGAQRRARATVVLISSSTESSPYVRAEIARAIQMARPPGTHLVVPVFLEEGRMDPPYGLEVKGALWWSENTTEEIAARIEASLASTPSREPGTVSHGVVPRATTAAMLAVLALWVVLSLLDRLDTVRMVMLAGWMGVGLLTWILQYATPELRRTLGHWCLRQGEWLRTADPAALVSLCQRLVQRVFGEKVISLRGFARSTAISLGTAVVVFVISAWHIGFLRYLLDDGGALLYFGFGILGVLSVGVWALSNILTDFLSLVSTWSLLRWVQRRPGPGRIGFGLLLDTTIITFLGVLPSSALLSPSVAVGRQDWGGLLEGLGYALNALILGNSSLPVELQDTLVFAVYATLLTGCLASVLHWLVLVAALASMPFNGLLYRVPGSLLIRLSREREGPLSVAFPMATFLVAGLALWPQGLPTDSQESAEALARAVTLAEAGDHQAAAQDFEIACHGGQATGCVELARLTVEGRGQRRDHRRFIRLLERACLDLQNGEGCFELALSFDGNKIRVRNSTESARYLRRACGFDHAMACTWAGDNARNGTGVARDDAEAVRLYRKACDDGNALGCSKLGLMYANGMGIVKDAAEAARLYRKACDAGSSMGCHNLGVSYQEGTGVVEDATEAVRLYLKACDGGDAKGCFNAAFMFHSGTGVPEDDTEAVRLYRKACDAGHGMGCTSLGIRYDNGMGNPEDDTEAARLYREGCDASDAPACEYLGAMYLSGRGVPQDYHAALPLLRRAFLLADPGTSSIFLLAEAEILTGDKEKAGQSIQGLLDTGYPNPVALHGMRLFLGEPVATVAPELLAAWTALPPGTPPTLDWQRLKRHAVEQGRPDLAEALSILERPRTEESLRDLERQLSLLKAPPSL